MIGAPTYIASSLHQSRPWAADRALETDTGACPDRARGRGGDDPCQRAAAQEKEQVMGGEA